MSDQRCAYQFLSPDVGGCMEIARFGKFCGFHHMSTKARQPTPSPEVRPCPGIRSSSTHPNPNDVGMIVSVKTVHCEGCRCAPGGRGELTLSPLESHVMREVKAVLDLSSGLVTRHQAWALYFIIDRLTGDR